METRSSTAGAVREEQFSQEEAQELTRLLTRFVNAYGEKPGKQTDEDWLKGRFLAELPEMGEADAADQSRRTIEAVREYDENLSSLRAAWKSGRTTSEWFAKRAVSSGLPEKELAERLETAYTALARENGMEDIQSAGTSDLRSLAKAVGSQAELAGLRSTAELSVHNLEDDKLAELVKPVEAVAQALESGHDAGYKAAAAGAFKVAAEKALVPYMPPQTPVEVMTNLACAVVEKTKTLQMVANKTIRNSEAANEFAAQTVITTFSGVCGKVSKVVTDTALTVLGAPRVVRKAVGDVSETAGRVLGRMVGNKVKEPLKKVIPAVASAAKKAASGLMETLKAGKKAVLNTAKSVVKRTLFH